MNVGIIVVVQEGEIIFAINTGERNSCNIAVNNASTGGRISGARSGNNHNNGWRNTRMIIV